MHSMINNGVGFLVFHVPLEFPFIYINLDTREKKNHCKYMKLKHWLRLCSFKQDIIFSQAEHILDCAWKHRWRDRGGPEQWEMGLCEGYIGQKCSSHHHFCSKTLRKCSSLAIQLEDMFDYALPKHCYFLFISDNIFKDLI